jgi:hypothetical protein
MDRARFEEALSMIRSRLAFLQALERGRNERLFEALAALETIREAVDHATSVRPGE